MRLIDLDKLVANFRATKIDEVFPNWKELNPSTTAAVIRLTTKYRAIVLNAPIVDASPVVHGLWINSRYSPNYGEYEEQCSHCKEWSSVYGKPYCPNCGAKMDGV